MRVVHLYDGHEQVYEGRGSVPGVVWNVARETAAAGHDVAVLERRWAGLPATARHEGVRFDRLDLRTGADEPWTDVPYQQVTSARGLLELVADRTNFARVAHRRLRALEFDVLHVHLPFAANVLATLAPGLRDRTVYTAHLGELRLDALQEGSEGSDETGPHVPGFLGAFSPDVHLASRAAHTTVLNPSIERVFAERGVDPAALTVVPNGVDVDRFADVAPETRRRVAREYGFGEVPTLLLVGTVMPRKGVAEAVEVVARLAERGHEVRLLVAGEATLDSSYVERVRRLISSANLETHVRLLGFVPAADLPALYTLSDLVVAPSLEEGFGMTVAEAMAAGTPVVGTRVGGIPRLVGDDECGSLVDPGDVAGLTDRLDALLSRPDRRARMGERASVRAQDYDWPAVADRFLGVYEGVCGS
ncbi:glycosyltransferase family 4 protein [Halomarina litorea]|uniref:glycosyltransferase family 4 protein n=1 Tax=Halomarina litorea TaxID=2961595 RepID=UPI0020C2A9E2|nr:glycosyltransferase family 4 protein [Halomarina sp. BCD28]